MLLGILPGPLATAHLHHPDVSGWLCTHSISSIPCNPTESPALPATESAGGLPNICVSSSCPHFAFSSFALSRLHGFSFSLFLPWEGCAAGGAAWLSGAEPCARGQTRCHRIGHSLPGGLSPLLTPGGTPRGHQANGAPKPTRGGTPWCFLSRFPPYIPPHCSASFSIPKGWGQGNDVPFPQPISDMSPFPWDLILHASNPSWDRPAFSKGSAVKEAQPGRDAGP